MERVEEGVKKGRKGRDITGHAHDHLLPAGAHVGTSINTAKEGGVGG